MRTSFRPTVYRPTTSLVTWTGYQWRHGDLVLPVVPALCRVVYRVPCLWCAVWRTIMLCCDVNSWQRDFSMTSPKSHDVMRPKWRHVYRPTTIFRLFLYLYHIYLSEIAHCFRIISLPIFFACLTLIRNVHISDELKPTRFFRWVDFDGHLYRTL